MLYTVPGIPLIYTGDEIGLDHNIAFMEKDPVDWESSPVSYRELLAELSNIRRENPALHAGNYGGRMESIMTGCPTVLSFKREVEGNTVHVTVGSVEHPMTDEHFIEWICLETEHGIQYAHLDPNDKPKAKFALCEGDEVRAAWAFCNQHSLWRK